MKVIGQSAGFLDIYCHVLGEILPVAAKIAPCEFAVFPRSAAGSFVRQCIGAVALAVEVLEGDAPDGAAGDVLGSELYSGKGMLKIKNNSPVVVRSLRTISGSKC